MTLTRLGSARPKDLDAKAKILALKPKLRHKVTDWSENFLTKMILLISACHQISFLAM